MPGILKIGRSINGGRNRALELYGTGVPLPFKMEFEAWSPDCINDESYVHDLLDEQRINKSREFFKVSVSDAIECVLMVIANNYNLRVEKSNLCVTGTDLMCTYTGIDENLFDGLFLGIPKHLVLTKAISNHLSIDAINAAVRSFKKTCEDRRSKIKTHS
ncbi:MAG: hypothetical protein RIR39_498 [Pseudomonadota bacterium]